jgi:hypothetical protein
MSNINVENFLGAMPQTPGRMKEGEERKGRGIEKGRRGIK